MRDRFLEIHFSSSRGRFAHSFKFPFYFIVFISTILSSTLIFMLISTIVYFSNSSEVSQSQMKDYIHNKLGIDSLTINSQIQFVNPISEKHFYITKGYFNDTDTFLVPLFCAASEIKRQGGKIELPPKALKNKSEQEKQPGRDCQGDLQKHLPLAVFYFLDS